ncbi:MULTISPECIES: dimethylarginine dimethylaminohydrolase family protein [Terrabacteria group]|uniref:dimethylarginine dimethylaminohydrolase family protein n=1 Tax=Bacillati TaxID=1783272 RepID=UPI00193A9318|nr:MULTISPECIES: arginine deiminase-related protein [Terrabacteria group]MBW9212016.1 N(G),N(G)-dimethylarginine dimethylaminohydrolase [Trueperella sp. zg.1013]QRG87177.1 N(G),N(G)-dimethylarginine dimethylaminohydrolase [Bulleidia sp. zg-1006]
MLRFTNAIVRKPCKAMIEGIATGMFSEESPIYEDALRQHESYVKTLEELGVSVLVLEALEQYPDSCFVEDPAVVMKDFAVITNSPRETRNGEKDEILPAIRQFYKEDEIYDIQSPGTMEGGDVMFVDGHFYVGLSERTNLEGVRQFREIVQKYGYDVTSVPVTEGLHLKDFVIYLENGNMLLSEKMNNEEAFAKFNRFVVPKEELYAINSLYINGTVMVPDGFPKTKEYIESLGYPVKVVNTDEFKKIDGSLTCLSLRFEK